MAVPVLRALSVGEMLDASIKIYRRNFLTLAKAVLVVAVPGGLIVALIQQSLPSNSANTITTNNGQIIQGTNFDPQATLGAGAVILVATLIISAVASAICFKVVGDSYLGHPTTSRQALRYALGKFPSVLWLSLLVLLSYVAIWVVPVLVVVGLVAAHSTAGAALAGFLLLGGALLFTVWFWVSAQLAIPSLMLEDYRGTRAIRRAIGLVRGNWWRSFGALFLMTLLTSVVSGVVVAIFAVVTAALRHNAAAAVSFNFVIRTITYVVITPVVGSLLVVLFVDLRVRKEGFDIHLLASQLGSTPSADALSFMSVAPRGYLPPGYPPQGYPPPGYPPPGYPPPGYPPPGYPPPGYPPPGYPPPGYPPPGYPPQGYPPQGYPTPGYPAPPPDAPGEPPAPPPLVLGQSPSYPPPPTAPGHSIDAPPPDTRPEPPPDERVDEGDPPAAPPPSPSDAAEPPPWPERPSGS